MANKTIVLQAAIKNAIAQFMKVVTTVVKQLIANKIINKIHFFILKKFILDYIGESR